MIFLPLNLQLLTSTFLCNRKMAGANVEAVGAGCDVVLLWSLKYHQKRTWASTNFWDSTSSNQDCFILLIFILIAKLLCTHESSIKDIFCNIFLNSRMHFSNIEFTHVHRWQALVIPSERRTGLVLWIHGSWWRVNWNTGFQNKISFSSWSSCFMFQISWNISRVF